MALLFQQYFSGLPQHGYADGLKSVQGIKRSRPNPLQTCHDTSTLTVLLREVQLQKPSKASRLYQVRLGSFFPSLFFETVNKTCFVTVRIPVILDLCLRCFRSYTEVGLRGLSCCICPNADQCIKSFPIGQYGK